MVSLPSSETTPMPPGSASLPDITCLASPVSASTCWIPLSAMLEKKRRSLSSIVGAGTHFLGAGDGIDPHQLAERAIHHPQIALGVEIARGGNLEAVGDHRQFG